MTEDHASMMEAALLRRPSALVSSELSVAYHHDVTLMSLESMESVAMMSKPEPDVRNGYTRLRGASVQALGPEGDMTHDKDDTLPHEKSEFKKLCALSAPIVFTYILEFLPGVISIMLVGRMDSPLTKEYVGGATLSSMFIYLSGEAPGFGLATALDTLCSQAYGAGKPQRIGISFQTGVIVLSVVFIPIFFLNWYSEQFMIWMHQPEEVTELAGIFSRWLLPGLPFLFLYELLKKVMQAQNVVAPMVWIAILSNVVNLALGIWLTWYTSLGYEGAAIARTISNVVLPAAAIPYFMWKPEAFHVWWPGFQPKQALAHVKVFLTLGVPGMFMLVLEWLSYEIMAVFVGWLPNSVVAISVHSVLSNVANIAFHVFIGISVAATVMVGNYVGSGQHDHAKMASQLGMKLSLAVAVLIVVLIAALHRQLPQMFIGDDESVSESAKAILSLIPFELLDSLNCVMQGVFRGTGRQKFAAILNLLAYFVVGLPFGFLLAFQLDCGVQGFWLGLTGGYLLSVCISLVKICRTDWIAMSEEAEARLERDES
ncbi:hypothetical protein Poli38472_014384 [Pythium oligandrum]|uniref:Multidrug and toxic compound extrusion protein n=1 Tax=Pythium oligandrum TaxID=41045 RepID=A0A8K1FCZ7_PYTOL|nr:hypothetical protein Poli38472_014384 [Pythium oligandrum]|eukprot:TMW57781.1 hypothetical protein Poli38472_014384 [Pythium oligandrum]